MIHLKNFYRLNRIGLKPRGDSILEVVIATAILSTVLVATFDILQRAIDTNLNVKNRVIALNIGREGLEAVRNIRDTNWLKYSGDRRGKWLCHDTAATPDACEGLAIATDLLEDETYYFVDFDTGDNRYYLSRASTQVDIDFLSNQPNREEYRLFLEGAPERYVHGGTAGNESVFYRQIYLDIENPYDGGGPTFCDADDPSCNQSRLKVLARVYWQEDGRQRSISLESHLFDFFERDAY